MSDREKTEFEKEVYKYAAKLNENLDKDTKYEGTSNALSVHDPIMCGFMPFARTVNLRDVLWAHEWTKKKYEKQDSTHHDMYRDYEKRLESAERAFNQKCETALLFQSSLRELQAKYDKVMQENMGLAARANGSIEALKEAEALILQWQFKQACDFLNETLKELGELDDL